MNEEVKIQEEEKKKLEGENSEGEVGTNPIENPAPKATEGEPTKVESTDNALATRKFAEGAKKKEKEILSLLGVASIDEAVQLIQTAKEQGANYTELAAKSICADLDVKKEYREVVIDIAKGKGLEITEENVKSILDKHPEWIVSDEESDSPIVEIGKVGGKGQPEAPNEREKVRSWFK